MDIWNSINTIILVIVALSILWEKLAAKSKINVHSTQSIEPDPNPEEKESQEETIHTEDQKPHTQFLFVEPIGIELGLALVPLANPPKNIQNMVASIRKQFALELGLSIPRIHIHDHLSGPENEYRLLIRGNTIETGVLYLDQFLAISPEPNLPPLKGIKTKEPVFSLDAIWIDAEQKSEAMKHGYTVVDPIQVLVTHLSKTIRWHATTIFDYNALELFIQQAGQYSPFAVKSCIPDPQKLFIVLRNLLSEGISIRDQQSIIESFGTVNHLEPDVITEHIRKNLKYQIKESFESPDGIHALIFDDELRSTLNSLQKESSPCSLSPETNTAIINAVERLIHEIKHPDLVVLCPPLCRTSLQAVRSQFKPSIPFLSRDELPSTATIITEGTISISTENNG